jgi:multidrug efflux pump
MRPLTRLHFTPTLAGKEFAKMPEKEQVVSTHQPDGGFGGLVLKPWGERKRTVFQILPEVQAMVNGLPGIRMFMVTPPPLPTGGENFPVNSCCPAPPSRRRF